MEQCYKVNIKRPIDNPKNDKCCIGYGYLVDEITYRIKTIYGIYDILMDKVTVFNKVKSISGFNDSLVSEYKYN